MSMAELKITRISPQEARAEHRRELTSRNAAFVSGAAQSKLGELRILIAGCGSTGGACIEALARAGVERFLLADNGEYELTNLNRQHARMADIGKNKAEFHREEILAINPFAEVTADRRGIHSQNVREFCATADIIFDAVDVTTPAGIQAKLSLHRYAHELRKPVLSALDLGFRQWGMSFDYRDPSVEPLHGRMAAAQAASHPIRALFSIYPVASVPSHCLQLIIDLLEGRVAYASQLGCTSDALSAIIVPVILRFAESGRLPKGWCLDLDQYSRSGLERALEAIQRLPLRFKLARLLRETR